MWDNDSEITNVITIDAPFDMFKINVLLYGEVEALLEYEKSIIAIKVKIGDEFISIRKLTEKEVVKGFDSSERAGLLHNFRVLDEVACELLGSG